MLSPDTLVTLRDNVVAEPLFNSWYVTLPMIAPHTSAMLVKNQHVKILKSYLLSPDMHVAAAADPGMRGGPFANIAKERIGEVRQLLQSTLEQQAHLIRFAEGVEELDKLLKARALGYSMEALYPEIPDVLKGYVELVYDLNNVPAMRFIEGLLYKSPFFDTERQSMMLSLSHSDTRDFVLSTPRLADADMIEIRLPFHSAAYDILFGLRSAPRRFGEVCDLFQIDAGNTVWQSLFAPAPAQPAPGHVAVDGTRVRYFGHACLLFETAQQSILFDPLIAGAQHGTEQRYTLADLPPVIDYVVITHGHLDHMVLETLMQLRYKVRNIVVPRSGKGALQEPSLKLMLRHLGFECNVIELDDMEELRLANGAMTGIPFLGEHHDLNISGKLAYHLRLDGHTYLIAADSANLAPELYDQVRRVCGAVDTIFLGMECDGAPLTWFYGHLMTRPVARDMSQSRQGSGSDQVRASKLVASLGCRQVFIYAMGLEHWFGHILSLNYTPESKQIVESDRFLALSTAAGIAAERLYAMRSLTFGPRSAA